MKKINFSFNETIYEELLDNGFKIYMYPTNKSKNFYVTISTYFGSKVSKYKKNGKVIDVRSGSAHFLEHRVMDFSKDKKASELITKYGTLANAYTTFNGTNYNLFGKENIKDNIKILLDKVFYANLKEEDVQSEKGIILEEYYMYEDDPDYILEIDSFKNAFNTSYIKVPVIGETKDIKNANLKELKSIYHDFYRPDNMFMVICGDFNKTDIVNFVKDYMKNIKNPKDKISPINLEEKYEVVTKYEEKVLGLSEGKIALSFKVKIPKEVDKYKFKIGIDLIIRENFSLTGDAFEMLSKNNILNYDYLSEEASGYLFLMFSADTNNETIFKNIVMDNMKNLKIDEEILQRKKKSFYKSFIFTFEEIENVEELVTNDLINYKKILFNRDKIINSLTLKEVKEYLKSIDLDNHIIVTLK